MNEYWKAHIFDEGILGVKFDDCHSVGWDIEGLCPDCEKYMCLIAAAPDLLEALEVFMSFDWMNMIAGAGGEPFSQRASWNDACDMAYSALAKARGEQ